MKNIYFLIAAIIVLVGCEKEEIDDTPPVIDSTYASFPVQCSEIKRGESFIFKARFEDDVELGSFGLDIHHNFDHHNHSTEVGDCEPDPVKTPVHPYVLLENYSIPGGLKSYEAEMTIDVPSDIDSGDYHFMIKVTDRAGWQTLKGLSMKIKP